MIIGFGELLIDMIRGEEDGVFRHYPGGAPANFCVGLARLGLRPRLIASVGRDFFGDMLVESMQKENIDVSGIKRSSRKTTLVFVQLKDAVPSYIFYRQADIDISKRDIRQDFFENAKWFHFGSLSLTDQPIRDTLFHCLRLAKKSGLSVSFSPNIRSDLWNRSLDSYLHEALRHVDVLIASEDEYSYMSGKEGPKEMLDKFGIRNLIITKGKSGCEFHSNGFSIRHPAFRVSAVDTTGAGDAFSAGFVYSQIKGKTDKESLIFASAAAALSTTKKGAMSALPTLEDIRNFTSRQLVG